MTRTPAKPGRTRRARVLCVGLEHASDALAEHLAQSTIHVKDLFAAMGELTGASASQPIDAVLVASDVLLNTSGDAVATLRDIDPSVRMVLVRDTLDPPELDDFADDLFDDSITLPMTPQDVPRALGASAEVAEQELLDHRRAEGTRAGGSAPPPFQQPDAQSQPPAPPVPAEQTPPSTAPQTTPAAQQEARPEGASPSAPPPDSAAPVPVPGAHASLHDLEHEESTEPVAADPFDHAGGESLGDVDLVNAMLRRDNRLAQLALRLIAQQTGWSDVTLHRRPGLVDDASAATVTHDERTFGMLTSARTTARQLKPWADWLGYWLALDASFRRHRMFAYRDDLTGAWNRRYFKVFLSEAMQRARNLRLPVTVMVFDIDDFKQYNDRYSHEAGDEILIETVRLMQSVIRRTDRVCRIGGDEFAVIFADLEGPREAGSTHPETVNAIAKRFQKQVCTMRFAKLGREAPGPLTISGGLATFPWDGSSPEELLNLADQRALQSKRAGKNVITFGPDQPCP